LKRLHFMTKHIFLCLTLATTVGISGIFAAPPPPGILVQPVVEDSFVDRIEALGTLKANESVDLTAKVTETIVELNFVDGARVKKGDVLARMVSVEEEALLTEASSTAMEARKQFDRARQLAQQGASSQSQLDEARRVAETARARVIAIQSRIQDLTIVAPFDGIVGLRDVSVGALVQPGDLIATIDDDSVMKLDFTIPSTFLEAVEPGARIVATARAFDKEPFEGEISSISSRVDPVTRTVTVRAMIPNPERRLKPGLLMTVELLAAPRKALVVPEEALIPMGRKNFVLVVSGDGDDAVAERREVEIGGRREGEVEMVSGLSAGERVVTHGTLKVAGGGPVRVLTPGEDGGLPENFGAGGR
jgi:membrane fusion protein, multidrug efflux system